jgi:5-methylthioribose kinase
VPTTLPAACTSLLLLLLLLLQGPSGGVCLKQSLPFVRCVGEGWPLSQDRCRIEAEALMLEHKLCPQHTPQVGHSMQQ